MYFKVTISYKAPEDIELLDDEDAGEKIEIKTDNKSGSKKIYKGHKESYLVDADSVTFAEAKILRELPDNHIDKDVKGVIASNVNRVIFSGGDQWFLAGIKYEMEMTKKGKMLYCHEYVMINGDDFKNALNNLEENHRDSVTGYKIVSLQESKILVDKGLLTKDTIISD